MFFNNLTETWENRSIVLTDGYGEAEVELIPGKNYKIFLSKDSYIQTGSVDWQPESYSIYDVPETKVFQMKRVDVEPITKTFWDLITFNGTMNTNGSIHVYYVDSISETINANFHTNEAFNFTSTLKSTNYTTSSTFDFWATGLNASRVHKVTIHLNHTTLGWINITITIEAALGPKYYKKSIENIVATVLGDFTLGYENFFLIFIPAIVLLVVFGPRHAGIGIIGAGLYMGFSRLFIEVPTSILVLIPLIVAIGFIFTIVKGGGKTLKKLYVIIIFIAIFQFMALTIRATAIFPEDTQFYSDIDQNELEAAGSDTGKLFALMFVPKGSFTILDLGFLGDITFSLDSVSAIAVIIVIIGLGSLVAVKTHSYVPAVLAIFGVLFVPMIYKSTSFVMNLFRTWNQTSMTYLAVTIVVTLIIIMIVTILETPTHGGSG